MKQASKAPFTLPDFALPFVTRALRGGRSKRYFALSGLLALMTLIMGTWMALGDGPMERDLRVSLDLEQSRWEREETEFTLIADDDFEFRELSRDIAKITRARDERPHDFLAAAAFTDIYGEAYDPARHAIIPQYSRVSHSIRSAYDDVNRAARSVPPNREARLLRDRAAKYLGIQAQVDAQDFVQENMDMGFEYAWYSPDATAHLESILDRGLIPHVERYASPLDAMGAVKFIGSLAAWLLAALCLVAAPIATAMQHAREVHQNTLQPLTGTSFTPGQLTRGLRAGFLAPIFILGVPLGAIAGLSALVAGKVFALPLMAFILAAAAYALVSLAQLFAHVTGKRRTPGMIGVAIMGLMGMTAFTGMIMGFEVDRELYGALGAVPQAGFTFTQRWVFGNELGFEGYAVLSILVGATAWAVIGALVSRVVANRIGGNEGPSLSRKAVFLGALVSSALVTMAYAPLVEFGHVSREEPTIFYFVGLMSLAVPFAALLMARVPLSEAPTSMRTLPLLGLLAEVFAMIGVYTLVTMPLIGAQAFNILSSPVGIFYAVWGIVVVALVAVRAAATPPASIWAHMGVAWSMLCVFVAGVHAAMWSIPGDKADAEHVIAMWQLSPILGMLQITCIIAVPLLLVRGLARRFAKLS